jgi:hypothetical protein
MCSAIAARIENLNFASAKTCAILGLIDRLIFLLKNRRYGLISRYWPRLAGLIVPTMELLTLPTSISDGRTEAAFCCWCGDEAHAASSNVSVSSSVVVFIFAPLLKTGLVAFRDLNFVFSSVQSLPQPLRPCHSCSSLPFVLLPCICSIEQSAAAINSGRLRSARRKKFSIAGAFSAQADNGE